MSLIPFILDLADELHEFSRCLANGIDINDFGFGLYTGTDQQQPQQHQQQPQQQQQQQQQPQTSPRRSRTSSFSSFWMPSKRHHPYNRIKTACCAKSGEEAVAVTPEKSDAASSSIGGTPGKSASYSVVNKNGFQVSMNVKQFAPNELSVKTIDNCIVVEGRHDDKEDGHGVISRHFVRKYMLPKGYDPNDVLSTLSSDGILTVKAPPPPPPTAKNDEPNERIIEIQPTPGPTPVLVVSAKDTPAKETSKKLATTPSARLECQLPEKRQKLDLPPEPEPEESAETPAPIPPATATATVTETESASVAVAGTEVESNDVDMEKADEQINEVVLKQTEQQQQQTSVVEGPENEVEKKAEIIEQKEKEQKQKLGKIGTETEKKVLDECMTDSNGDSKTAGEKMEESSSVTEATAEVTEKTNETPAAAKVEESVGESNVTKMEVDDDGDNDGHDDVKEKTDNKKVVVATIKTADSETKTAVKAAAGADSAKKNTDKEKTNNTDTSSSNSNTSTTTTTTTNNNNNTSTNSNSATTITNNSSTESVTENSANDVKGGNGVVTGNIPVDIPKSTDSDAANTATAKTKAKASADSSKAESVPEGEHAIETAVLGTDTTTTTTTTKNIIDDVALLKAATADPADITDNAEENVILSESMDGITTTTTTNPNTNTTTTTVDNVECSLFAKKSHLGNGNNTTATPVVGTEEMAN